MAHQLINGIGVSLLYLVELLIHLSWNPQVYEPMEVLDQDHSDNHRRAPHWHQYVPWQICQLGDLRQPTSPVAAVQKTSYCDNSKIMVKLQSPKVKFQTSPQFDFLDSPLHSSWDLMNGLQISTCLLCDKHQERTGEETERRFNV